MSVVDDGTYVAAEKEVKDPRRTICDALNIEWTSFFLSWQVDAGVGSDLSVLKSVSDCERQLDVECAA